MRDTDVIEVKYFKDSENMLYAIDIMPINKESWESEIKEGWAAISKEELDELLKNTPTEEESIFKRDSLLKEVSLRIAPLQDSVDLDIATDEEVSKLNEWKKYRVLLNRIESQPDYPNNIDWPEMPN
ncbi:tail fiber assembly protein [Entomomonas asaccharolytica]|uniref:Tail fiber assembly protein n=1 Tax=Entomomonas asaccharolytica TaxID=2785331 RepID=A0A974NHI0_9GAMM|nr:tail fiber assembly protein [Entomomonas asaccharolytica]